MEFPIALSAPTTQGALSRLARSQTAAGFSKMPIDGSAWPSKLNRVPRPEPARGGGEDGQLVGDERQLAAGGGRVARLDLALLPGEVPGACA